MTTPKVPPLLHKMSLQKQREWYSKNNMQMPSNLTVSRAKRETSAPKTVQPAASPAPKPETAAMSKEKRLELIKSVMARKKDSADQRAKVRSNLKAFGGQGLGSNLSSTRGIINHIRSGGSISTSGMWEETENLDEKYKVVGKTKQGERFKSGVKKTKKDALAHMYRLAKSRKYADVSIERAKMDEERKLRPIEVHDLTHLDNDRDVYDETQVNDKIKHGDVLKLKGNRTAIMDKAWPVMHTGTSDHLHRLKSTHTFDDLGLSKSAKIASSAFSSNVSEATKKTSKVAATKGTSKLAAIKAEAQRRSKNGYVQHVNRNSGGGGHHISDWYDADTTVASFFKGKSLQEGEQIDEEIKPYVSKLKQDWQVLDHEGKVRFSSRDRNIAIAHLRKNYDTYRDPKYTKKLAKEETENLDELKKATLASYVKKAAQERGYNGMSVGAEMPNKEKMAAPMRKMKKRMSGIKMAVDKLAKEEVEQIDELKKSTLGNYIKKAAASAAQRGVEFGVKKSERDEVDRITNRHMSYDDKDKVHQALKTTVSDIDAARRKVGKRLVGISRAADKLKGKPSLDEAKSKVSAPPPGKKWYGYAVMVHPETKQRVVIDRKNTKNYPESEGWREVAPGMKAVRKEETEFDYIEEKLTGANPPSEWISDFVRSKNPKFDGKSKKERINMALGAYYAAKGNKNEEVEQMDEAKEANYKVGDIVSHKYKGLETHGFRITKIDKDKLHLHLKPYDPADEPIHTVVSKRDVWQESVEPVNEISKKLMSSYLEKASDSALEKAADWTDIRHKKSEFNRRVADRLLRGVHNRRRGISLVARKLAKEEVKESKIAGVLSAIVANRYEPKVGDRVRTRKASHSGTVEKIEGEHVYFRGHDEYPNMSGKGTNRRLFKTHISNVTRD